MKHKILDNTVIKCTSPEQGQKIRAFFLLCGVEEEAYISIEEFERFPVVGRYYGFVQGHFSAYDDVKKYTHSVRIVELPSEEFLVNNLGLPCEMEVWDDHHADKGIELINGWVPNVSHSWIDNDGTDWQNAKHIRPKKEKKTISMEELFQKAGLSAEDYIIE
jgi:hypothetical protein